MAGLILDIVIDKREYQIGELVEVKIILKNVGQSAASVTFTTSQIFDLVVRRGEETVFVRSDGRMFAQDISEFTLEPGNVIERKFSWTPKTAGSYKLEGQTPRFLADEEELVLKTWPQSVVVHT